MAVLPVYLYKIFISPLLGKNCRYTPSCSRYFIQAVYEFGIIKGYLIGGRRLLSCNPYSKRKNYDPVPINIKGDKKWLL